jgi:hypothetical protein
VTESHSLSPVFRLKVVHAAFVSGDNSSSSYLCRTNNWQQMSIRLCFRSSASNLRNRHAHSFWYPKSAVTACERQCVTTGLFAVLTAPGPRSLLLVACRYAARGSGCHVRGLHRGHVHLDVATILRSVKPTAYLSLASAQVELYCHSTIHTHAVLLKHRDNFSLPLSDFQHRLHISCVLWCYRMVLW